MFSTTEVLTGTASPITAYGSPVLHRPCAPVREIDGSLHGLVSTMFASMAAAGGVGLAANQIGVGLRIFVVDCPDATGRRRVAHVINPRYVVPPDLAGPVESDLEGCLSLSGSFAELARPAHAVVDGVDVLGRPVQIDGTGLLARCLQHEMDHLDGTVYTDRLGAAERRRVLAEVGAHSTP